MLKRFAKRLDEMSDKEFRRLWLWLLAVGFSAFAIYVFLLALSSGRSMLQAFAVAAGIGLLMFSVLALAIRSTLTNAEKIRKKEEHDARNLANILKSEGIELSYFDSEVVIYDPIKKRNYSFVPKRFKKIN